MGLAVLNCFLVLLRLVAICELAQEVFRLLDHDSKLIFQLLGNTQYTPVPSQEGISFQQVVCMKVVLISIVGGTARSALDSLSRQLQETGP